MSHAKVFAALLLISVVVRLPFFFKADLDWDEATYILIGQALLDGHLPYTLVWDLKPPLAYVPYALAIAAFGKTIVGVRILGTIAIALSAFLCYRCATTFAGPRAAFLASATVIVAITQIPGGQATMTEHLAAVPLMLCVAILATGNRTATPLFLAGLLIGIAGMIRLNLGLVGFLCTVYLAFEPGSGAFPKRLLRTVHFGAGGVVAVAACYLPYGVASQGGLWWDSVVMAPLAYAGGQKSVFTNVLQQGAHALGIYKYGSEIHWSQLLSGALLWAVGLAGLIMKWSAGSENSESTQTALRLLTVAIFATGASIVMGGAAHSHYLIQLAPLVGITVSVALHKFQEGYANRIARSLFYAALLLSLAPVLSQYGKTAERLANSAHLQEGAAYGIATFIRSTQSADKSAYFLTDHLAYWLLDLYPPARTVTHPSLIAKPFLLTHVAGPTSTPLGELERIFATRPAFVVKTKTLWYLKPLPEVEKALNAQLQLNYRLVGEVAGRQIYQHQGQ